MAEEKKKKIVSADSGEEIQAGSLKKPAKPPAPEGSTTGLRIGAIVLWVLAIVFEVAALLVVLGKVDLKFSPLAQLILFLVPDLACVIIGAQLWKKANRTRLCKFCSARDEIHGVVTDGVVDETVAAAAAQMDNAA